MGFIKRIFTGPEKPKYGDKEKAIIEGIGAEDAYRVPNAAANANMISQQRTQLARRPATQIQTGQSNEVRGMQMGLADNLNRTIAGTGGPSVAELQMRAGQEANIQGAMAQAASSRGVPLASLARTTARNILDSNQVLNRDAGILRAQEQAQAQNTLSNVLGATRGQDAALATSQAQLSSQERQSADQLTAQYVALGMSIDQARQKAAQDLAALKLGIATGNANATNQHDAGLLSGVASIGSSLITGGK